MDINQCLSPHFRLAEFLHNGSAEGASVEVIENLRMLSKKLELIRAMFGKPVTITSGFRTPKHNAEVGGVPDSEHVYGKAADFVINGLTPTQIYEKLEPTWPGGLGHYPANSKRKGWIHADIGPKRRWEG